VSRAANDLRYFARTAVRGLRASPVTTAVAATTIAICLVLVGTFALLVQNMQGLLARFGEEVRLSAYLDDGLDDGARRTLAERAGAIEGVERVELVTKEQALERFRARVGEASGLLAALDENPLPASLELTLAEPQRTPAGLARVAEALGGLPGVGDLAYGQEWVAGYAGVVRLVETAAVAVGSVLALAALLIVANTIRLAVYARGDELDILSLVGASRPFIATPFLIEGVLQGAAGGLLAVAILWAVFRFAFSGLEAGLSLVLGFSRPEFFGAAGVLALVGAGAALGLVGSALAMVRGWR
jgi:cell division transport system permease protein